MKYIGKYANADAIQRDLNMHRLGKPYVAYNTTLGVIDWDSLADQNIPTNEIWYKTSDNQPITITNAGTGPYEYYGAALVSNNYDADSGWCKAIFDGNVTHFGKNDELRGFNHFSGKTALTDIILPNTITTFTSSNFMEGSQFAGFRDCTNLVSVFIPPVMNTWVGERHFYKCRSLTSVNIPDGVTRICDRAFDGCSSLTSIDIPDSVTSIGDNAFSECTSLPSIDIPDSITSIGDSAFFYCISSTGYHFKGTVPPSIQSNSLYSVGSSRKIYVPASAVETYKAATNFSQYANYIVAEPAA